MVVVPTPESVLPLPWMLAVQGAWVDSLKTPVILVENASVSFVLLNAENDIMPQWTC